MVTKIRWRPVAISTGVGVSAAWLLEDVVLHDRPTFLSMLIWAGALVLGEIVAQLTSARRDR